MKKLIYLLPFLILASCSTDDLMIPKDDPYADCRTIIGNYSQENADPVTGLIQGDIIPDRPNKSYVQVDKLWKDNTVPFYFSEDLPESKKSQIINAINIVEANTYIRFIHFQDEKNLKASYPDGIKFSNPTNPFAGNSSYVGRQGGIQLLTLAESSDEYVIQHEIFHALGHEHEHTRPDRDEHIIVHYDNIPVNPTLRRQMDKKEGGVMCSDYDTTSGMHYGSFNGASTKAIDAGLPAITTIKGELIPVPTAMSKKDFETNKILYPKKK